MDGKFNDMQLTSWVAGIHLGTQDVRHEVSKFSKVVFSTYVESKEAERQCLGTITVTLDKAPGKATMVIHGTGGSNSASVTMDVQDIFMAISYALSEVIQHFST
jgi:hypothetical protein